MATTSRRTFLEMVIASTAAAGLPLGCNNGGSNAVADAGTDAATDAGAGAFFTADERTVLGKLLDHVFPPDDAPGASALGAVDYVEKLLTAFDVSPPRIWAGGPFSGRQPFIDPATGGPSATKPANSFATFLPLHRYAEAGWRLRLYGSTGVRGGGPNDAVLGPTTGWRDMAKQAIATTLTDAGVSPAALTDALLDPVWVSLDADTQDLLTQWALEGALGAPEYGGNKDLGGWKLTHFEGDSQPLGYSQLDSTGKYHERPDAPLSTANPGTDPEPMTADTDKVIADLAKGQGGRNA